MFANRSHALRCNRHIHDGHRLARRAYLHGRYELILQIFAEDHDARFWRIFCTAKYALVYSKTKKAIFLHWEPSCSPFIHIYMGDDRRLSISKIFAENHDVRLLDNVRAALMRAGVFKDNTEMIALSRESIYI